jgi:elongation factor G
VVCEADDRKIPALEIVLRELEEAQIPRILFVNKIDTASRRLRETVAALQKASRTPLLLRQIPIWKDGTAVGFIDLALERAFVYREHAPSDAVALPDGRFAREREARFAMLERLGRIPTHALMEDPDLRDRAPEGPGVRRPRPRGCATAHVVPVLIGSADRGNGVHAAPQGAAPRGPGDRGHPRAARDPDSGPPRAARPGGQDPAHRPRGKVSIARILRGP